MVLWLFPIFFWTLSICGANVNERVLTPTSDYYEFIDQPPINYYDNLNITFNYHDYGEMTAFLRDTTALYPHLTALYSIGKSVQNRNLWVLLITANPYKQDIMGKPNVKYVANIHGNEAVSRELMLHLIHNLVRNYNSDLYIQKLLNNTRIHIMPSMNPDGFEVAKEGVCDGGQGRYNARGFDLNRNFPDYFKQNNKKTQPETNAVKEWISKIQFVLSGSLHGGALVASYPFDNTPNSRICTSSVLCSLFQSYTPTPSLTPDDDVFKHLSLVYAQKHRKMSQGTACKKYQRGFNSGITNGAEWYPLTGGMQDYNYVWYGCMEITLEISCCKYPPASELETFWEDNRRALIEFLGEVHRGVYGQITDDISGKPIKNKASLKIRSRDVGFQSTQLGEFWRILLPGFYTLEVYADGYQPRELDFEVLDGRQTILNITMVPASKRIGLNTGNTPVLHYQQYHKVPTAEKNGIFATISTSFNNVVDMLFG